MDYNALYKILEFFGFGPNFIKWVKILFTDFTLCTTNYGHQSPFWTATRGLYQGNPCAPYLFLYVAEILSMKLRENPKVEGLEYKGIKFLLSQFADDMDLFLKFKESVWQATMYELDKFESLMGMKISYEKTTIYRIESIRY